MHKIAIVKKGIVPVYAKPKVGVLIDEIMHGMPCVITKESGMFARIKTFYGYEGYVDTESLKTIEINKEYTALMKLAMQEKQFTNKFLNLCFTDTAHLHMVSAKYIDALKKPKVQAAIIEKLPMGAFVQIKGVPNKENWQKIILQSGEPAYIKAEQIIEAPDFSAFTELRKKSEIKQLRKNICKTALSFLGTQYTWGGKSALGIDCSGLAFMAYMLNGIVIYRDAKIKEGYPIKSVEYMDIEPADLIYFPGHVAIYLGKGEFIHATAQNGIYGVVVSSFNRNSSNYAPHLHETLSHCGKLYFK